MKIEHKALIFAVGLAAVFPACTIVNEKPADSTPPAAPAPPATATVAPPATVVVVPVATASAAPTTSSTLPIPGAILKPPGKAQ